MEDLTTIGMYRIEAEIGAGAHGTVYRAQHPVLDTPVAIKLLHDSYTHDAQTRARLLDEARALLRLRHPGIVHLFDVGEHEGRLYLVMELLETGSLRVQLDNGPRGAVEALRIARALAAALAYAHARGVLHGDLKPENVLLREDRSPVLVDFGLLGGLKPAGNIAGSPAYMAPEQLLMRPLDERTDVYALGVLMYEMVAGGPPFGTQVDAAIEGQLNARPPQLRSFDNLVPPGVDALVAAMLAKDPDLRPRDMDVVAQALEAELGRRETVQLPSAPSLPAPAEHHGQPPALPGPERPLYRPRRPVSRLALAVVAAGAAMFVIGMAGSLAGWGRGEPPAASPGAQQPPPAVLASLAANVALQPEATVLASPTAAIAPPGGEQPTPDPEPTPTEEPLEPVELPIVSTIELVEPTPLTFGDERWSIGNVGVHQDGVRIIIYGLLRNDNAVAQRDIKVRAILRDSAGAELFSDIRALWQLVVLPGETAMFDLRFDDLGLPAEGSYTIDYEILSKRANERYIENSPPVPMSDVTVGRRYGGWVVEGRFQAGSQTLVDPIAIAAFMDGGGKVVGIGFGFIGEETFMQAGSEKAFRGSAFFMFEQPASVLLVSQSRIGK